MLEDLTTGILYRNPIPYVKSVHPPLEGPSFELCRPVTVLADGRWIWPTSTWRD